MPAPNDYFYYTRRERRAVLTLVLLLSGLVFYRWILPYWTTPKEPTNFTDWKEDLVAFESGLYQKKQARSNYRTAYPKRSSKTDRPTQAAPLLPEPFDPNTCTATQLETIGLPPNTIKSILNYRSKGGRFRVKADLAKIYTLSEAHFAALKPYIQLPDNRETKAYSQRPAQPLPPAFPFDPNTCTEADWRALGGSERTTRSILNYRSKGGQFRQPEDLQKIYTLPDSVYQHLRPYIQLKKQPQLATYAPTKRRYTYRTLDINEANPEDFEQFRGIGPSYAKRLVRYRTQLGGFLNIDQVGELYRLPDSTFQHMRPHLNCAPITPLQININTATLEELKAHPYLSWSQARAIVTYRTNKGPWKSVDLVQILPELDDGKGTFKRIRPYLTVN